VSRFTTTVTCHEFSLVYEYSVVIVACDGMCFLRAIVAIFMLFATAYRYVLDHVSSCIVMISPNCARIVLIIPSGTSG
jgi:hypothetical protein